MSITAQPAFWSTMQTLLIGPLLIVVCVTLATRFLHSARWQKATWQAAILATLWLLISEMTGVTPALIDCCRARWVSDPLPSANWKQPTTSAFSGLLSEATPNDPTVEPEATRLGPRQPVLSQAAGSSTNRRLADAAGSQDRWQQALASFHSSDDPALPVLASAPVTTVAPNALPIPPLPVQLVRAEEGVTSSLTLDGKLPGLLTQLWILGSGLLFAAWIWKRVRLALFRRTSLQPAELSVVRCVADLASRLRIRRPVGVHTSSRVTTPVTFGWRRPVIVVPEAFPDEFDARQQQVILAHELAHVAAWDPLWQLPADLATIFLWWHPSVWWANRSWRIISEMVADDACLVVPDGPEILAESLVRMGRRWQAEWRLAGMAMTGLRFRSGLGRRVQRLLQRRLPRRPAPGPLLTGSFSTVLSAVVLGAAVSCTAWAHGPGTPNQGANPMKALKINWRQSLAAAALSVWLGPATTDLLRAEPADENQPVAQEEPAEDERHAEEGDEEARDIIDLDELGEFEEQDEAAVYEVDEREEAARNVRARTRREERRELEEEEGRRLRRRLQSPRPDQDAEARAVTNALRWLRAQQDGPLRGERERDQDRARREIGRLLSEQLNLRKQMENLERALAERPDEQRLRDEMAEVNRKLRRLQTKMGDRDVTRQRALQILSELELLHQNPLVDDETSSNLEVELALLLKQLQSLENQDEAHEPKNYPLDQERPDVKPERVRRRSHLRAAIENLRAAGLHDQAEAIAQHFDEMSQQRPANPFAAPPQRTEDPFAPPVNAAQVQQPEGPFSAPVQRPDDPFGHPHQDQTLERTVRDLHKQVQAMQEQLEQIRAQLQQLTEQRSR